MAKLWGARFAREMAPEAKEISYSLKTDQELFPYDIQGTTGHIKMLAKIGILKTKEAVLLTKALKRILESYKGDSLDRFSDKHEDVHSFIYAELEKRLGPLAKKVHSGRSRNDQVATATRLYLKDKSFELVKQITSFQKALISAASKNKNVAIPGYTHLQRAQAVLLAHHLLAYVEMLERDKARLLNARELTDEMPLGSGALSGSTLPLNRETTRKALGFKRLSRNSLDAVSSRDFVLEFLSCLSIMMIHLSRLSEDVILWNSSEFGFIELRDDYATGSSLMPHKKNPDFFELARGKSGAVVGNLVSVLMMMKGLPLAYNRDMQEDKSPLFQSFKIAGTTLEVLEGAVNTLKVNELACQKAVGDSYLYATDLLDYLVSKKTSFKDAHDQVGSAIAYAASKNKDLRKLSLKEYKRFAPRAAHDIYRLFSSKTSIAKKKTIGSTSPGSVKTQIAFWKKRLK